MDTGGRFLDYINTERFTDSRSLGVRSIPVKDIVGSVNRWQDFDSEFRPKSRPSIQRFHEIKVAESRGAHFPAIQVYKVGTKYYVVDGNHRVALAKHHEQEYIDADVTEFLPPNDTGEHILARERSHFEFVTGLFGIHLGEFGMYSLLLRYIGMYRDEIDADIGGVGRITMREAASRFKGSVYDPLIARMDASDMMWRFPDNSEGELFLYIIHHRYARQVAEGKGVGYVEAMDDLLAVGEQGRTSLYAKVKAAFRGFFITARCQGCGKCATACPEGLVCEKDGSVTIRKDDACRDCGACGDSCAIPGAIQRYEG